MKNKFKILITGANGQLGQSFAQELKRKKTDFLALTSDQLDITDFEKARKMIKKYNPCFVINCAAYNEVDKAEKDWQKAFLVNGIGVKNLVLACNNNNSVFIHFSSDYVFNGKKESAYTIADSTDPINRYGESKYLGEKLVENLSKKYYLIRLSWVFGKNPGASFPLKLIEWAKKNKNLRIVNDEISSPSFVKDITKATLDLINTGQYGLYHMTNKGFCSRYEWAKYILEKINWEGEIIPIKSKELNILTKRPKFSVLDNFPLKYAIGYELPSWQDATERFLKEIKEQI